jgi:hypothetical protein
MMCELVVLHEGAVNDGHAEVDIQQNRHRLQLANDHVAEDADEGKNSLRVSNTARQLAPGTLPLLEKPLQRSLQNHAEHPDRMEHYQKGHSRPAETAVDGHLVSGCDRECDCLRISVEEIDVARAPRERAR